MHGGHIFTSTSDNCGSDKSAFSKWKREMEAEHITPRGGAVKKNSKSGAKVVEVTVKVKATATEGELSRRGKKKKKPKVGHSLDL